MKFTFRLDTATLIAPLGFNIPQKTVPIANTCELSEKFRSFSDFY